MHFKVGDIVQPKYGGYKMLVEAVNDDSSITCTWSNSSGESFKDNISPQLLRLWKNDEDDLFDKKP